MKRKLYYSWKWGGWIEYLDFSHNILYKVIPVGSNYFILKAILTKQGVVIAFEDFPTEWCNL